jgi:hypothetical protein
MKPYWLVWNPNKTEFVGFDNEQDAVDTAYPGASSLPSIGYAFREAYADDDEDLVFMIQRVEIPE